jgi:hypothetical protein
VDILMEQKTFGLLIAVLFFLISFLFNLLQRRYSKARLDRLLRKEKWVVVFLARINRYLGKLERSCTLELSGASSSQEVGKAIHVARDKIQSTITNMEEHLHSFRHYRRKEKAQKKQAKRLEKLHRRPPGR